MSNSGKPLRHNSVFNINDDDVALLRGLKTAEDIRLYTSQRDGALVDEEDAPFRTVAGIISKILNVQMCIISFTHVSRRTRADQMQYQAYPISSGVNGAGDPRDILVVKDTLADHRFKDDPLVVGTPNIRFYAELPIVVNRLQAATLVILDQDRRLVFGLSEQKTFLQLAMMIGGMYVTRKRAQFRRRQLLLQPPSLVGTTMMGFAHTGSSSSSSSSSSSGSSPGSTAGAVPAIYATAAGTAPGGVDVLKRTSINAVSNTLQDTKVGAEAAIAVIASSIRQLQVDMAYITEAASAGSATASALEASTSHNRLSSQQHSQVSAQHTPHGSAGRHLTRALQASTENPSTPPSNKSDDGDNEIGGGQSAAQLAVNSVTLAQSHGTVVSMHAQQIESSLHQLQQLMSSLKTLVAAAAKPVALTPQPLVNHSNNGTVSSEGGGFAANSGSEKSSSGSHSGAASMRSPKAATEPQFSIPEQNSQPCNMLHVLHTIKCMLAAAGGSIRRIQWAVNDSILACSSGQLTHPYTVTFAMLLLFEHLLQYWSTFQVDASFISTSTEMTLSTEAITTPIGDNPSVDDGDDNTCTSAIERGNCYQRSSIDGAPSASAVTTGQFEELMSTVHEGNETDDIARLSRHAAPDADSDGGFNSASQSSKASGNSSGLNSATQSIKSSDTPRAIFNMGSTDQQHKGRGHSFAGEDLGLNERVSPRGSQMDIQVSKSCSLPVLAGVSVNSSSAAVAEALAKTSAAALVGMQPLNALPSATVTVVRAHPSDTTLSSDHSDSNTPVTSASITGCTNNAEKTPPSKLFDSSNEGSTLPSPRFPGIGTTSNAADSVAHSSSKSGEGEDISSRSILSHSHSAKTTGRKNSGVSDAQASESFRPSDCGSKGGSNYFESSDENANNRRRRSSAKKAPKSGTYALDGYLRISVEVSERDLRSHLAPLSGLVLDTSVLQAVLGDVQGTIWTTGDVVDVHPVVSSGNRGGKPPAAVAPAAFDQIKQCGYVICVPCTTRIPWNNLPLLPDVAGSVSHTHAAPRNTVTSAADSAPVPTTLGSAPTSMAQRLGQSVAVAAAAARQSEQSRAANGHDMFPSQGPVGRSASGEGSSAYDSVPTSVLTGLNTGATPGGFSSPSAPSGPVNPKSSSPTAVASAKRTFHFGGGGGNTQTANRPLRVLLIEDSILVQKIFGKLLKKHGCEVRIAKNGKIGLQLLKTEDFDVTFMDFLMPVQDGLTTMLLFKQWMEEGRQMQKQHQKLSESLSVLRNEFMLLIGISDIATKEEYQKAQMLDMHFFCKKPVAAELIAVVMDATKSTLAKLSNVSGDAAALNTREAAREALQETLNLININAEKARKRFNFDFLSWARGKLFASSGGSSGSSGGSSSHGHSGGKRSTFAGAESLVRTPSTDAV